MAEIQPKLQPALWRLSAMISQSRGKISRKAGQLPLKLDVGRWMFDVRAAARHGPVAQRLEQGTHNPLVPGSNPGGPTPNAFGLSRDVRRGRRTQALNNE